MKKIRNEKFAEYVDKLKSNMEATGVETKDESVQTENVYKELCQQKEDC